VGANLGAEIGGVDLRQRLTDEVFNVILDALVENELLIFRNQNISSDNLIDFGRRFGELTVHPFSPHDENEQNEQRRAMLQKLETLRIAELERLVG
jgi:taurine dioxygenase